MGKITGFLEIDRHDRKYAPVAERVKSYRDAGDVRSRRRLKFWPSRRLSTKRCAGADHFDAVDRPASHSVVKYADN